MDALLASGGVAGCERPPDPIDFNEQTSAGTVCTERRSCIYVVYIYKDITDATRRRISRVLGLPDVCVCTDCSANRFKCFGVLMLMGGGLHFYISYCSELDGVIFLMYIN